MEGKIFYTLNKRVACSVWPKTGLEKADHAGGAFKSVKQKADLVELTVLHRSEDGEYWVGDKIFVDAECAQYVWAKKELSDPITPETKMILVPYDFITGVLKNGYGHA